MTRDGCHAPLSRGRVLRAVRETILGARAVVTAHPWTRRVIETCRIRTPAVLGHMERLTQVFLRAGFPADLTHHVMHLLGNRIWGSAPSCSTTRGAPAPSTVTRRARLSHRTIRASSSSPTAARA